MDAIPMTKQQLYSALLDKWVLKNEQAIDISRITKAGDYRLVTAHGKQTMRKAMQKMGILTMERMLVQELPEEQWTLGDGRMEYVVIDGNHRLQVAQELSKDEHMKWLCDLVSVRYCHIDSLLFFFNY